MPLNGIAGQHQIFDSTDLNTRLSGSRYIPSSPIEGTPAADIELSARVPTFDEKLDDEFYDYIFKNGSKNRFVLTTQKRDSIKFWLNNLYTKLRGNTRAERGHDNNYRHMSRQFYLEEN